MKHGIRVTSFSIEATYPGLLAGIPNKRMNAGVINGLRSRNFHVIVGEDEYSEGSEGGQNHCMGYYTVIASLISSELTSEENKKFDFRELTVAFFVNSAFDLTINQIVEKAIENLDWEKHSELVAW